jgi:hypothetical protein
LVLGCKSTQTLSKGQSNLKLTTRQLIKENAKQAAQFKTFQSKLKITFEQKGKSQTHSVNFRAEKDKILWISAAFSVIRAEVTPEKVRFYNKLDNTYFDGDFKYLSDLLGTELDFQKVQNVLFGETIYNLKVNEFSTSTDEISYVVQPKEQQELFELFFLIYPTNFKVKSQQISQIEKFRHLQIDYLSYQEVDKQILPEQIKVMAAEANEETIIGLEYKSVILNEDLRFPFKIPSGFEKIELE